MGRADSRTHAEVMENAAHGPVLTIREQKKPEDAPANAGRKYQSQIEAR